MAGTVKAKRSKKFATSDWMELEKKRGISVTSSVMSFPYKDHDINLIDTPGHQDFSEDTYRTLTAVDSALMLIDAANGVEPQTIKLFEVCALQETPTIAFINKLDRPGKTPFELLEDIEKVLGIGVYPVTWPIGSGDLFKGIYNRSKKEILLYDKNANRSKKVDLKELSLEDPKVDELLGEEVANNLREEIELIDGAGDKFDLESYKKGKIAPVLFGSALNNFGVQTLLENIIEFSPSPVPRKAVERVVEPAENKFTAFVFKIQANMDPSHRDRVAFMRICSGRFERGMKAHHVRLARSMRLGRPTNFMAQDRSLVDEAFAGDIVGIHDPGVFRIGDTLSQGESLHYTGVPVFAPEYFVRVELADPLKSKQLNKGLDQLSEEGAVQVFRPPHRNEQFLGVVGMLQIDVVKYRIKAEYGVEVKMNPLPFTSARWLLSDSKKDMDKILIDESQNIVLDSHNNPTLLLDYDWRLKFYQERYPKIRFLQTSEAVKVL